MTLPSVKIEEYLIFKSIYLFPAKKLEAAQPVISLEERRRIKEAEQARREAEKRRKFMEKELEKAKKREEVQKVNTG